MVFLAALLLVVVYFWLVHAESRQTDRRLLRREAKQ